MRFSFVFALLMLLVSPAKAITYSATIESSTWELESSIFACRLTHKIPSFGDAVFEREAGESVHFILDAEEKVHFDRGAILAAEAPMWRPGELTRTIGTVQADTLGQLDVKSDYANAMLAALHKGMMPTFSSPGWYGTNEFLRVAVSSVNFADVYNDYVQCVAGLLPVNYRQVARTAVLFPPGEWRLSDSTRQRLDLIALYAQNDDSVKAFYVDGHSDAAGRRLANRDLSKQRADVVTEYLTSKGVPAEMIVTRFHGERYPVVPNNTAANRARNRRVTIRLERE
ncbi:MAG: flagellar protein MotY [Pontibacterium sp.]